VGNGVVVRGRDEIFRFFDRRLSIYSASSHHVANVLVTENGDEARVRSYVYARVWPADGSGPGELWGRYEDEAVRGDDGEWRFHRRELRAAGWHGYPELPGQPEQFERIPRGGGGMSGPRQ
jgi:hypothetical protein